MKNIILIKIQYITGLEDDDDFENLIIDDEFDLVLRKFITKVNDVPLEGTNSREPKITQESVDALKENGTAIYYHSKSPLEVVIGDTVVYTLRIYNEGTETGLVRELTDYLPAGLKLKEEGNNGWYTIKENSDGSKIIKRPNKFFTVKPSNGITGYQKLVDGTNISDDDKFWVDVEIECEVESKGTTEILRNVAEISDYVLEENGYFRVADEEGVDRDSEMNNVFSSEFTTEEKIIDYYDYMSMSRIDYNAYAGIQDDDDFEAITVTGKSELKLQIQKLDEDGNQINGTRYSRSTI